MAKRKTKRGIIGLVVMVAVLAALIIALVAVQKYNASLTEEEEPAIVAFSRSGVIVENLKFGDDLAFTYVNDAWVYDIDEKYPVDSDTVNTLADSLMSIEAVSVVDTEGADTASFGLGEDAEIITVTFSDEKVVEFRFGIINSYNGYQYFTYSGADSLDANGSVWLVETSLLSSFDITLDSLYKSESSQLAVDGAVEDNVTSVEINTATGDSITIDYEGACTKLFELIYGLGLTEWEDYYADETEMAETYGISKTGDRVAMNYTLTNYKKDDATGEYIPVELPKTYIVYFGYEFETVGDEAAEKRCYFTFNDSTVVYSATAEQADEIFEYLSFVEPVAEETTAETEAEEITVDPAA